MSAILELDRVSAGYGESIVIDEMTLAIGEGECVAVMGRNGVGKTTLIATVMGIARQQRGTLRFRGRDLAGVASHERARRGLGWVPQERAVWRSLTVREHLDAVARPGEWSVQRVFDLFPKLAERANHGGSQLSGGEQQMLAIGRALVTNPAMLLLDEPLEGLAPIVIQELVPVLRDLAAKGAMTIVLVEQHAPIALSLGTRAIVMDRGRIVLDRPSDQVRPADVERWLVAS